MGVDYMKSNKDNAKKFIDEYLKNKGYGHYYPDKYTGALDKLNRNPALNCSDYDDEEEFVNRLEGAFVREHIMRKPTAEELEWMKSQEPVTDPEVLESLRPVLEWLNKYAVPKKTQCNDEE